MNIGEIREDVHNSKAHSHLPLSSPGGKNLGQAPREKTAWQPVVEPDKPKSTPPVASKTEAPVAQQGPSLPATIFGIPTSTVIKFALGLSITVSALGLVVKLRDIFGGRKR